jgi:hypothetical protein
MAQWVNMNKIEFAVIFRSPKYPVFAVDKDRLKLGHFGVYHQ